MPETFELSRRPTTEEDRPFLEFLYGTTRSDELALTDWSDETKRAFVRMQFEAQDRHYREVYPDAEFSLLMDGESPIGRLYLHRNSQEIRIIDIALVPKMRGLGIGETLLRAIQREATATGRSVSIHVERFNPALSLYQRLGFRQVEDKGVYLFMKWDQVKIAS